MTKDLHETQHQMGRNIN